MFKLVEGGGGGKRGFEDFGRGNQMDFKGEWRGLRPDLQSTNRGGAIENRLQINYQWGV